MRLNQTIPFLLAILVFFACGDDDGIGAGGPTDGAFADFGRAVALEGSYACGELTCSAGQVCVHSFSRAPIDPFSNETEEFFECITPTCEIFECAGRACCVNECAEDLCAIGTCSSPTSLAPIFSVRDRDVFCDGQ